VPAVKSRQQRAVFRLDSVLLTIKVDATGKAFIIIGLSNASRYVYRVIKLRVMD
jgi:hypothetical protein